jgi:hypothetical protein
MGCVWVHLLFLALTAIAFLGGSWAFLRSHQAASMSFKPGTFIADKILSWNSNCQSRAVS